MGGGQQAPRELNGLEDRESERQPTVIFPFSAIGALERRGTR